MREAPSKEVTTSRVRKGTAWYKMDDYKVDIEACIWASINGSTSQHALFLLVDYMHKKRRNDVTEAIPSFL